MAKRSYHIRERKTGVRFRHPVLRGAPHGGGGSKRATGVRPIPGDPRLVADGRKIIFSDWSRISGQD